MSLHDNVVKAGDTAPDFSIKADNGKTVTAQRFRRQTAAPEFLGHLVPALRAGSAVARISWQRELGPKGLVVLGVSVDKDEKAYKDFLDAFPCRLPDGARSRSRMINPKYGTIQIRKAI